MVFNIPSLNADLQNWRDVLLTILNEYSTATECVFSERNDMWWEKI